MYGNREAQQPIILAFAKTVAIQRIHSPKLYDMALRAKKTSLLLSVKASNTKKQLSKQYGEASHQQKQSPEQYEDTLHTKKQPSKQYNEALRLKKHLLKYYGKTKTEIILLRSHTKDIFESFLWLRIPSKDFLR